MEVGPAKRMERSCAEAAERVEENGRREDPVSNSEKPDWGQWKEELETVWKRIPKPFRSPKTIRRTLQCALYSRLAQEGRIVLADYFPPRVSDRPVDLVVLDDDGHISCAVCFDDVVTLYAVKSLTSFDVDHRVIFTLSPLKKKVEESRFFLKPEVDHIHLEPFGSR